MHIHRLVHPPNNTVAGRKGDSLPVLSPMQYSSMSADCSDSLSYISARLKGHSGSPGEDVHPRRRLLVCLSCLRQARWAWACDLGFRV